MYRVEILNQDGASFKVRSEGCEFIISSGGKAITPPAALLASLGSCIGVYARKYLEGAGIASSGFNIAIEAEFSKEKPVCFAVIDVTVDLKGVLFDERRKDAFLSFVKNCPVHNTLRANPEIKIKII
ncbi:MAG: OsmC family protein [Candidatus Omnitrophota bacterium]|nr:OsmC family protein [Candidatus Omnitrophota bacterium]